MPADRAADDLRTDSIEATSHPFIVRIWLEEPAEGTCRATWRGHITHVPSGKRIYIADLDQIREFVTPYLEELGVTFGMCDRLRCFLGRLKEGWRPGL